MNPSSQIVWLLILLILAIGLGAYLWSTIRFNLRRRAVYQSLSAAPPDKIDHVLSLIGSTGSEPSIGGILVRTDKVCGANTIVAVPEDIGEFPWAGRSIRLTFGSNPSDISQPPFSISEEPAGETQLDGRVYRFFPIPRTKTRTGKLRNIFDPKRYIQLQPKLEAALVSISKEHPLEVLSAIVCDGCIEFEPLDQIRIGTSAEWAQQPEWQQCDHCRRRMNLILQLPGVCTGRKEYKEGTLYLFGCKKHPLETKSVVQFT